MAASKPRYDTSKYRTPQPPIDPAWKPKPFIQFELSNEEKKHLKEWFAQEFSFEEGVVAFFDSEYKITLKHDARNHCASCFIECEDSTAPNAGRILTGRGSTPITAFAEAAYKHFVCFQGAWPNPEATKGLPIWDK